MRDALLVPVLFSPQSRKTGRAGALTFGQALQNGRRKSRAGEKKKRGDRAVLRDPRERKEKTKKPSVRQNHPHRSVPQ